MTKIHEKTVVPYTANEMYALVNDIESYPAFLPWCIGANVSNAKPHHLTASVDLEVGKFKYTFTTENAMQPGENISMRLIKGPFKYLKGHWQFKPVNEHSSTVLLDMDFEFKNKLIKLALATTFNRITASLVESFAQRAAEVYGQR